MTYILKELAVADKLQAMKLAPAPNISKANAVGKYRSILRSADDSWDGKSSYADSSSKDGSDSSQEKSLRVVEKHHRDKQRSGKSSRSSKRSSDLSISDSSSKEERKPKKKAVETVSKCKYCKRYRKTQHPKKISTDQCMWNKKAVCFQYASVCKHMNSNM